MRFSLAFKTLVGVVFMGLTLTAWLHPAAFALDAGRASHKALWFTMTFLAAAFGAKLTVIVPAFGAKAHLTAPLILTFAAPFLLRATVWKTGALNFVWALRRASFAASGPGKPVKPAYPAGIPAALPARVAVALAAAARARK